jgi:ATP-dependent HslUV protease ATP-binding subunit HslU
MDYYIRIVFVIVNSRMISCTFLLQQVLKQQVELIATEGVTLTFENDAILEIARIAAQMNKTLENIGARRLHTVIERIMEEISFNAAEEMKEGEEIIVTKALVQERLSDALVASDLSRFIL